MMAYAVLLFCHSYVRWALLASLLLVGVRASVAWARARAWVRLDERLHVALIAFADTQFALGLGLYAVSPISRAFLADAAHAVHDHGLRFFGLEHPVTMLLAISILHAGRRRSKLATLDKLRHRRVATSALVALAFTCSAVPWPGLRHGRALFRGVARNDGPSGGAPQITGCPALYAERCAVCHGARGAGDGVAAPSLHPPPRRFTDPEWGGNRKDAALAAVIREGGAARGLSAAMPAQADLSAEQIDSLVACIRALHRQAP